jgi:hypothetical protein
MGARYERWLIARASGFTPAPESIAKLVDRLRKDQWIADAGAYAVKTVENRFGSDAAAKRKASREPLPAMLSKDWFEDGTRDELRLVWPAEGAAPRALKYPLSIAPEGQVSYSLQIHRADEYVVPSAKNIGALPTACNCGEDLTFEWDEDELVPAFAGSTGIFAECEECSRTFDPTKGTALVSNPFDGASREVRGGGAYRFALMVDAGENFVKDARLAFAPELVALLESEFGRELYEVGRIC